jgi:hypothetical protein
MLLLLKIPFAMYQIPFGSKARVPVLGIIIICLYFKMLSDKSGEIKIVKNLEEEIGMFSRSHINVLI